MPELDTDSTPTTDRELIAALLRRVEEQAAEIYRWKSAYAVLFAVNEQHMQLIEFTGRGDEIGAALKG
jgi:hypothetical protein